MKKTVSIVIPIYKTELNKFELVSWNRCKEVFQDFDIIIAYPQDLDISNYSGATKYIAFPNTFFKNTQTYSQLMCSASFYKKFIAYEYILIYQLDTFVFENNLLEWCSKGYSYIGSPWIDSTWIKEMQKKLSFYDKLIYPVGNGGLSLRKVKIHYHAAFLYFFFKPFWRFIFNEDIFWSSIIHRIVPFYTIPKVNEALKFSFEEHPEKCFELNDNELPFGCHAWEKYNTPFWQNQFKKYGYKI